MGAETLAEPLKGSSGNIDPLRCESSPPCALPVLVGHQFVGMLGGGQNALTQCVAAVWIIFEPFGRNHVPFC